MDKAILAVDELVGFITAVTWCGHRKACRRAGELRKELKDKAFARSVNRADIALGVEELR